MKYGRIVLLCTAAFLYGMLSIRSVQAAGENGWHTEEDGCYWYENGEKQGTEGRGNFYHCPALKALRLDSFDTSNVMDMGEMFCYCSSLESLDLRSFCTKNVSYAKAMFAHCTGLKEILVGDGWTMRDREYFFTGCGVDHVTLVR